MKKILLTGSLLILIRMLAFTQATPGEIDASLLPFLNMHYNAEYTFDTPINKQAWVSQKSGLHVSLGSTDIAYFRTEVPVQKATLLWKPTGWRGERLNTEILIWSPDTLNQVRVTLTDLVNAKGVVINRKYIKLYMIRYVLSNYPYGAKDPVCGNSPYKNGYLMPDRFEAFDRFDLPGKTVRPIWLSLDVPAGAEPGLYTGNVVVSTTNSRVNIQVKINVQKQILPSPKDWKYRLDLWQNPWVIAWKNHLKPWSDEHKVLLKKHLQLYADAGGKYITTYAVHSPWADNSYMIEGGMIEWIKKKDGGWKFDYTVFDTYVELAMRVGIDKAITIYTAVPWGDRFRYKDESTGNYMYESWSPDSKTYSANWNTFLTDLKSHLLKKGWFNKTYIGINENEMNHTLAAIKVIKKHSKGWKITYAGNWHKELDGLLDDYSFLYGKEPDATELKQRAARGATSTFYVCCNPPKPNNFVFSPPIEGMWISWYAAATGYDGFLRWAYDAWPEDPVRDARFGSWPAGDCFLVYPGANSSVRFEKLREGIVDYEKIRLLKDLVAKSTDKNVKDLWQAFEQHLKLFTEEHDFNEEKITADVNKGKAMVDVLSDKLGR
ncbi:MAG: glycoside hydrolase domain-containing protein [Chitinophagales bacterium]